MSAASLKKIIPCKNNQLIEMVLDIEKYPEFVPWCIEGKINEKKENENTIEMKGDLKVGKKFSTLLKNSETHVINGCGHMIMIEKAFEMREKILKFLNS